MMTKFAKAFGEEIGFEDHYPVEVAMTKEFSTFRKLMNVLPSKSYVVVGGAAVVLHVGKAHRIVSPDIDVLMTPQAMSIANQNFSTVRNQFGLTIKEGSDIEIDMLVATKTYQRKAINESEQRDYAGTKIPVISAPNLIVMKMMAGRDKDEQDVLLLLKHQPAAAQIARLILKSVKPDLVDDLRSLIAYAKLI